MTWNHQMLALCTVVSGKHCDLTAGRLVLWLDSHLDTAGCIASCSTLCVGVCACALC
jgi:hypothetical protein